MKWTKKYPTKEGWYWYSDGLTDFNPIALQVKKCDSRFEASDEELCMDWKKGEVEDGSGRWSDSPIPEPPKRKESNQDE